MAFTRYSALDNQTITWETIAPASGDLCIMFPSFDGAITLTTPSGWTRLDSDSTVTSVCGGAFYRVCDGSESGNAYIEADFGVSSEADTCQIIHIPAAEWHGSSAPESPSRATATSGNPTWPSSSPSWGAEDNNIWVIAAASDDGAVANLGAPVNYTTNAVETNAFESGGSVSLVTSWRSTTAGSEDPGTGTTDDSAEEWIAWTVAVRGPSSAATQTILPDADIATTGWSTAPLHSKLGAKDGTTITATAS